MFRVLSCLGGQHDLRLVALAEIVCFVTSFVAITLFHRAGVTKDRARLGWIATAGMASGCGIWATHFIAMLAYAPGVPVAYHMPLTVLSLVIAWLLMSIGIAIAVFRADRPGALVGGAVIGLAIAGMHFVGMLALEVPGRITWSADLAIASIVLGMAFGMAAMDVAVRRNDLSTTLFASLALTLAIVSLHFTAMGAIILVPDPTRSVTPFAISPTVLALCLAAATSVVLATGAVGSIVDRRISEKSEQLDAALHNMLQGLCMSNAQSEVIVVNRRFADMFGVDYARIRPGMNVSEMFDLAERAVPFRPGTRAANRAWSRGLARADGSGKTVFQRTDGRIFSISQEPMPATDGWVQTFEDITERRQAEDKIAHMARHDALTGLPNRMHFCERLDKAFRELHRTAGFAVLCLDLDHFKSVNDMLGHQAGDRLLQVAAARIREALRESDVVARFGGDEFAVLQLVEDQPAAATALAGRLVEVMSEPIALGEQQMPVGVSIGISLAPADGGDAGRLLKNADMALYRAKADGRGTYCFFESGMDARMQARRILELDLRTALTTGAFELHYQPIVNVTSGEITSFEALLRWRHPTRGMIAPLEFIPLAEETGLIVPIGEWVLQEACAEAVKWPDNLHVAVNLSPAQFKKPKLVASVVDALSRSRLSAQRLELEITESVLLQDGDATMAMLHELRNLGVAISMDDFGTGYSSLSYLRKFPFNRIKIDKSFVHNLGDGGSSLAIIRAVTGLGSSLGIATIAEGVETADQLKRLKAEGCTEAQGYLFGAAKPSSEAIRHLTATRQLRVVA